MPTTIPTTRTHLRERMLADMAIRNFSPHTQKAYVRYMARFAEHFGCSPERLGLEHIRTFQVHLTECKVSAATLCQLVSALRFFYGVTLGKPWIIQRIPYPKKERRLPLVLSPEEVATLLASITNIKHRTMLTTCYSEAFAEREGVPYTTLMYWRRRLRTESAKEAKPAAVVCEVVDEDPQSGHLFVFVNRPHTLQNVTAPGPARSPIWAVFRAPDGRRPWTRGHRSFPADGHTCPRRPPRRALPPYRPHRQNGTPGGHPGTIHRGRLETPYHSRAPAVHRFRGFVTGRVASRVRIGAQPPGSTRSPHGQRVPLVPTG